jgi:60 kDa SS-A/Ro ribonucleoprotein
MSYLTEAINPSATPQTQPVAGRENEMVENNAGGFVFTVTPMEMLRRFLILGSENNFYKPGQKLTLENLQNIKKIFAGSLALATEAISETVRVSQGGLAPKNDPAIAVLALAIMSDSKLVRSLGYDSVPHVCRTGTHLLTLASMLKGKRNFKSRGMHRMFSDWFNGKGLPGAVWQMVKYQNREGFSMGDLMRLAHIEFSAKYVNSLYVNRGMMVGAWAASLGTGTPVREVIKSRSLLWAPKSPLKTKAAWNHNHNEIPRRKTYAELDAMLSADSSTVPDLGVLWAYYKAQELEDGKEIAKLVKEYKLSHEMLPKEALAKPEVWKALLPNLGMTALVRNLGNLSKHGVLGPNSDEEAYVVSKLKDENVIQSSRMHPINLAIAKATYASGKGLKGSNTWTVNQKVSAALESAFLSSFKYGPKTGKRYLLGLDVSGSMSSPSAVEALSNRQACAIMAKAIHEREDRVHSLAFSTSFTPIGLNGSVDDIMRHMSALPFAGTDCSLPMIYAMKQKIPVDVFCVFTDNETYAGSVHPFEALKQYRKTMGIDAKLAVCAFSATEFTIADPNDSGMMDIAGLDSSLPAILSQFASPSQVTSFAQAEE